MRLERTLLFPERTSLWLVLLPSGAISGRQFFCGVEMIGTFGYVILMHYRSPIAWLGHKGKWMRLRHIQGALREHRAFPSLYQPVTWAQVFGLARFVPVQPMRRVIYNNQMRAEQRSFYFGGWFVRKWIMWRTWLYPAQYVDVEASLEASRQESLSTHPEYMD